MRHQRDWFTTSAIAFVALAALLSACGAGDATATRGPVQGSPGAAPTFCGTSTDAACATDGGCSRQGCSGEVCAATTEQVVTSCLWHDCYDPATSGVTCGCVAGACRWH